VAFIRAEHLPPHVTFDIRKAIPFAPDLAVEVAAPGQHRPAMRKKALYYLAAGTRLVWLVWPSRQEVEVWQRGDTRPSRILGMADSLEGGSVLPGFTYPVAGLFA
jgi:Uma2 family endonuclease